MATTYSPYIEVASITVRLDAPEVSTQPENWEYEMMRTLPELDLEEELTPVVERYLGSNFVVTRVVYTRGSIFLTILIGLLAGYHAIAAYRDFRASLEDLRRDIPTALQRLLPGWGRPLRVSDATVTILPEASAVFARRSVWRDGLDQNLLVPYLALVNLVLLAALLAAATVLFLKVV